jgi:hypothetical protein
MAGEISLQRVQLVAGCIHVLRHAGYVKSSKKSAKAVGMFWLDSGFGAGLRKAFQPLVPIALYHPYSVWLHYTICQQFIWLRQLKVRLLRDSSVIDVPLDFSTLPENQEDIRILPFPNRLYGNASSVPARLRF